MENDAHISPLRYAESGVLIGKYLFQRKGTAREETHGNSYKMQVKTYGIEAMQRGGEGKQRGEKMWNEALDLKKLLLILLGLQCHLDSL